MNNRLTSLRQTIEKVLPAVDGVIALKNGSSQFVAPHFFVRDCQQELDDLAVWPKEPVPDVLKIIQKAHPDEKFAIVCRGCEERGIVEMAKHNQINLDSVLLIGLQCSQEEAEFCRCSQPYTRHALEVVGEPIMGVPDPLTDSFAAKTQEEKLAFWKEEFSHCIKCYGCRNICPQCFCNECTLEDELWVETGRLPMSMPPMYHLIRSMHMTAKCVACRECEETCPAGIPLAIQFRLIAKDVKEMFNYQTGEKLDQKPPQLLVLEEGEYERAGLPH
jgi:formate dehydrogenase (coenzyme F420) beta subunit